MVLVVDKVWSFQQRKTHIESIFYEHLFIVNVRLNYMRAQSDVTLIVL